MTAAEADRHIRAIEEALTKVPDTDPRAPVVKAIGQAVSALLSDAKTSTGNPYGQT
ncbi:hypothetical protein [Plastoroseomonas hellenica]|uniref:hypothetical protein n=1 Tax=Plastoroseomonas hellenica TaxID=2687306 RepID=UPI001BA71150|nr:hypothetical protein [Plastoroseomonas hellenica]MBR0645981.1 hypothetical protein [Plastoroseomonas hellenica]